MQNTLSEMWNKYNLLLSFKTEMNRKGYSNRDLYCLRVQLDLLMELIEIESMNVLELLVKNKTYFRLLKEIVRGIEYLPNILEDPEGWILNPIEKDQYAWIDKDVMVFSTRTNIAVFSKITRNGLGYHYSDGKYQ